MHYFIYFCNILIVNLHKLAGLCPVNDKAPYRRYVRGSQNSALFLDDMGTYSLCS